MTKLTRAGCLLFALSLLLLAAACGGGTTRAPVAPMTPPTSSTADDTNASPPPPTRTEPPLPPPIDPSDDINIIDGRDGVTSRTLEELNDPDFPLLEDVRFGFDLATLDADARATLDGHARILNQTPSLTILIEGHCDERGTVEYNLALGERRANQAYNYLMSLGIEANRMKIITYGKEFPADPGHNEQAWARNRRARFEITGK